MSVFKLLSRFHSLITMSDLFKGIWKGGKGGKVGNGEDTFGDVESGCVIQMTSLDADPSSMADFFREIGVVQGKVNDVKILLLKLQSAHEKTKGTHKASELKEIRAEMDGDIESVTKAAQFMKFKLAELSKSNLANRQVKGCEEGTTTDRQRMALTNSQRKKLKELMDEFQALRATMMDEYKETITRRYYNVTGKQADEETTENMIRTGESETFLQQAIRQQGRGQLIETIREVQERHDGVKEIERHFMEIHNIFTDISVLVDAQGQMVNEIQDNINRATSFTHRGADQLATARRRQIRKRKWTCVSILLLIVLILVLIIALKIAKIIP